MANRARVLFVSDLHKSCKEMSTIKGRLEATTQIQKDIINFNKENHVTHLVVMGDWYHRGYQSTCRTFNDYNEDKLVSDSVDGNAYLCLGNHFFLERDDNPEMYIIQPCEYMKPVGKFTMPKKPIFNVVPELTIGSVKISFFHYNKISKDYTNNRESSISYHIGVYHDDYTLPSWVREKEGYTTQSRNSELDRIYANIDLAVHGHIHTRIEPFNLTLRDGRSVPIIVPGSLGITQNKYSMKHPYVNLPLIDIDEDGSVSIKQVRFSTHIEMLRFYKGNRKDEGFDVKRKSAQDMRTMSLRNTAFMNSLPLYLESRGLDEKYIRLLEASIKDQITCLDVLKILEGDAQ